MPSKLFIHVWIWHLSMVIMLLINLIFSLISIFSAFLTIYIPLGVFTVFFSLMLTGTRFLLRHLNVNESSMICEVCHFHLHFLPLPEGFDMALTSAIQNNRLQHQPDGNNITIHHITKQHGNNISQTKTKLQKLMTIWQ